MKKLVFALLIIFSMPAFTHTLVIDGKKVGHNTEFHMVYPYVEEAGFSSTGNFIIRFMNGLEISLGKRSHWERFTPGYVHDYDQLNF